MSAAAAATTTQRADGRPLHVVLTRGAGKPAIKVPITVNEPWPNHEEIVRRASAIELRQLRERQQAAARRQQNINNRPPRQPTQGGGGLPPPPPLPTVNPDNIWKPRNPNIASKLSGFISAAHLTPELQAEEDQLFNRFLEKGKEAVTKEFKPPQFIGVGVPLSAAQQQQLASRLQQHEQLADKQAAAAGVKRQLLAEAEPDDEITNHRSLREFDPDTAVTDTDHHRLDDMTDCAEATGLCATLLPDDHSLEAATADNLKHINTGSDVGSGYAITDPINAGVIPKSSTLTTPSNHRRRSGLSLPPRAQPVVVATKVDNHTYSLPSSPSTSISLPPAVLPPSVTTTPKPASIPPPLFTPASNLSPSARQEQQIRPAAVILQAAALANASNNSPTLPSLPVFATQVFSPAPLHHPPQPSHPSSTTPVMAVVIATQTPAPPSNAATGPSEDKTNKKPRVLSDKPSAVRNRESRKRKTMRAQQLVQQHLGRGLMEEPVKDASTVDESLKQTLLNLIATKDPSITPILAEIGIVLPQP